MQNHQNTGDTYHYQTKQRIFKYLSDNFKIYVGPFYKVEILDLNLNIIQYESIFRELENVFGINEDELFDLYDEWFENESIQLNNHIIDICYDLSLSPNTFVSGNLPLQYVDDIISRLPDKYVTYLNLDISIP